MSDCSPNNFVIVGVDVSKDKLSIYDTSCKTYKTIKNDPQQIKEFLSDQENDRLFVMEYTGGHEKIFMLLLAEQDYLYHAAHPTRIHYFAKQKGLFAKTDKIDAQLIAQYGQQENVAPSIGASKDAVCLKELSKRRGQLVELLTIEKCRLKPFLSKETQRSIKRSIEYLEKEIKAVDQEIDKILKKDLKLVAKTKLLVTFKGIGKNTANLLVCLLPELGQVSRAQIACLSGLAPKNNDSGRKKGRRMISGGRAQVRKALYMAAVCAATHNVTMKEYYQKLKQVGKESKVALTAIMRKILITLNAMIRDNKSWNPNNRNLVELA